MKYGKNTSNIEMVRKMQQGERPITTVGYVGDKGKHVIRELGEKWTDSSGKEWIQAKSGPQTVTRVMDIVREESNCRCSACSREIRWGTRLDEKVYAKTGMCLDCLTDYETELKHRGVYAQYENKKMLENQLSYLKDLEKKLTEAKEYSSRNTFTYVNSNGLIEEWANNAKDTLVENLNKDLAECSKAIKQTEEDISVLAKIIDGSKK